MSILYCPASCESIDDRHYNLRYFCRKDDKHYCPRHCHDLPGVYDGLNGMCCIRMSEREEVEHIELVRRAFQRFQRCPVCKRPIPQDLERAHVVTCLMKAKAGWSPRGIQVDQGEIEGDIKTPHGNLRFVKFKEEGKC